MLMTRSVLYPVSRGCGLSADDRTARAGEPRCGSVARPRFAAALAVALTMIVTIGESTHAALLMDAEEVSRSSIDPAQPIPDAAYDGTRSPGTVASQSITVEPLARDKITSLQVTVAITHEYIGDLTIELEAPDGRSILLLDRPGLPFPQSPGNGGGDSSSLDADFPITFSDDAPSGIPAELMGAAIGEGRIVGTGEPGNPNNYVPAAGMTLGGLDSFIDTSLSGQWTLHVGDSSTGATGVLEGWSLTGAVVPEPTTGTIALAFIVSASLLGRRHRQRRTLNDNH